jgi:hypothetical protein
VSDDAVSDDAVIDALWPSQASALDDDCVIACLEDGVQDAWVRV